ncbi:MAG: penicillin-binding protein 2 [Solirubrobacteraceae bacterium]|nr:penicillin-binding protein 2 [Solirubrobacteraceae bacterium]
MMDVDRPIERQPPLSPQLAMRVAVFGGIALVLFGIVLFRLWYLEVLSGDQYVQLANNNRVRDVAIQAPRGNVVDRNGQTLVASRQATAVQIALDQLPPAHSAARRREVKSLGRLLGMCPAQINSKLSSRYNVPYANVTIKTDAGERALVTLAERQLQYPGVVVTPVFLRRYPLKAVAAQLLGNVGPINVDELKLPRFRGVAKNAVVGQGGIEWTYDQYLRGRDGAKRVQVDSLGRPRGRSLAETPPIAGHELKLSIDLRLQEEGQSALQRAIGLAQGNGHNADAGAFVALDPTNGEVLALGSAPSFNPTVFTHPLTQAQYARLSLDPSHPLLDRAIQGLYPTGSTFKPITAMAALQNDLITPQTPYVDNGCITVGRDHLKFCNAGKAVNGTLSGVADALRVSSDVFFYTLGERANPLPGEMIQTWARKLGLGAPTGIDLPGEAAGLIPDASWRRQANAAELACRRKHHVSGCAISGDPGHVWTTGDNVNFAVGQGDLQATPLQVAVAYSALFNGGTVVRPHIGLAVDDSLGRLVQRIDQPAVRHVDFNPANQQAIADGLHMATSAPGGTSYEVFKGFPRIVYGKTGTAQHAGQDDQSWFVAYAPDPKKPIVIAMTVERGGFGAETAAPAVRLMLSKWFSIPPKLVVGHSQTR